MMSDERNLKHDLSRIHSKKLSISSIGWDPRRCWINVHSRPDTYADVVLDGLAEASCKDQLGDSVLNDLAHRTHAFRPRTPSTTYWVGVAMRRLLFLRHARTRGEVVFDLRLVFLREAKPRP